jgi:hypothetical protein
MTYPGIFFDGINGIYRIADQGEGSGQASSVAGICIPGMFNGSWSKSGTGAETQRRRGRASIIELGVLRSAKHVMVERPNWIVNPGEHFLHKHQGVVCVHRHGIKRNVQKLSVLSNGMHLKSIARQHEVRCDVANESEQGDL